MKPNTYEILMNRACAKFMGLQKVGDKFAYEDRVLQARHMSYHCDARWFAPVYEKLIFEMEKFPDPDVAAGIVELETAKREVDVRRLVIAIYKAIRLISPSNNYMKKYLNKKPGN